MTPKASNLLAGSYLAQLMVLDDDDYPMGQATDPNNVAAGTVLASYIVPGFVEYRPAQPTYSTAYSQAGQRRRGSRDLGVTDYGTDQVIFSEMNDWLNYLIGGSKPDVVTATGLRMSAPNTNRLRRPRVALALTGGATPYNGDYDFLTVLLPNVTLRPARPVINQNDGRNPNNLTYDIVKNTARRTSLGLLFADTDLQVEGDEDTEMWIFGPAPIVFTTYVDDGEATSFLLPQTPYDDVDGIYNIITREGDDAHDDVTSIVGKTTTITPGEELDRWVLALSTPSVTLSE